MQVRRTAAAQLFAVVVMALAMTGVRALGADSSAVELAMTTDSDLSATAHRALVHEVERIWRAAGVRITWADAARADAAPSGLRVVVGPMAATSQHRDSWVVGELHRYENGDALATASIARAESVIRAAGSGRAHGLPDTVVQHRLGTVLGRALAHEIGHYLLNSGAHTVRGLMRATFQPHEFIDLRSGTFALDAGSQRRIHERLGATLRRAARTDPAPVAGSMRWSLHR